MERFEQFNPVKEWPICYTVEDKPCTLIPIDGTEKGSICKAVAVHISCIDLRFNQEASIFYQKI